MSTLSPSRWTAGLSCRALAITRSAYRTQRRGPSAVCCRAILARSSLSPSRQMASLSCRALTTRRSTYRTRRQGPSGITSLPQGLGSPTMAKSYSTSTQTIRTHLGLFWAPSSFARARFYTLCSWIYQKGQTCCSVYRGASSRASVDLAIVWHEVLGFSVLNHSRLLCSICYIRYLLRALFSSIFVSSRGPRGHVQFIPSAVA